MRNSITRTLGVLAIAGGVLTTGGCLGESDGDGGSGLGGTSLGGGGKSAACQTMTSELQSISTRAAQQAGDPAAMAQTYTDAANKIRTAAQQADGDVQQAGTELATAIDQLAATLRSASSGRLQLPDSSAMTSAGAKLGTACA